MADLIAWYNDAEARKLMTPVELAALFHYRYTMTTQHRMKLY